MLQWPIFFNSTIVNFNYGIYNIESYTTPPMIASSTEIDGSQQNRESTSTRPEELKLSS